MYGLILFICGIAIMVLELAGVRIMSPFFGSTHVVYTSIIGIIMASLSLGYWLGGKLSNKNPSGHKLSVILIFAGIYIIMLAFNQFKFLNYLIFNCDFNFMIKTIISSIIMFALPSVFLGFVSPYMIQIAINEYNEKENPGTIVGKYYAISTIGSIIGTFLCGFYLIFTFGIDKIFFVLGITIFICSIFCCLIDIKSKKKIVKPLFLSIILLFFSINAFLYFNIHPIEVKKTDNGQLLKYFTTPYSFFSILEVNKDKQQIRYMDNGFSIADKSTLNNYLFAYIGFFNKFFINKEKKNNILLLGNSVGTFLSGMIYDADKFNIKNLNFDVVELDKALTKIGEDYFNLPKNDPRITYFYEDARTFINRKKDNNKKYDLIYYDIYMPDTRFFPFYLITKETFEGIYSMTENNGIFVMNIIGEREKDNNNTLYINQVYTQIKSVYSDTILYRVYQDKGITNFIIAAYKNPDDINTIKIKNMLKTNMISDIEESDVIFTDNYSPVEKFMFF